MQRVCRVPAVDFVQAGRQADGSNSYTDLISGAGMLDTIEALQSHSSSGSRWP